MGRLLLEGGQRSYPSHLGEVFSISSTAFLSSGCSRARRPRRAASIDGLRPKPVLLVAAGAHQLARVMSFILRMNFWKAVLLCVALSAPISFADAREFRVADTQSEDYPTVQALVFMARLVAEGTGGRHRIRVFHSRQLGEEKETIEQTRDGAIDLNSINVTPIGSVSPAQDVVALPVLCLAAAQLHNVRDDLLGLRIL